MSRAQNTTGNCHGKCRFPSKKMFVNFTFKFFCINLGFRRRRDNGGKRNYTDEELSAAVSDIRSGKLGTRRASALYGVPRSTLRNKIFRLDSSSPQNWNDASHHDLPPESVPGGHLVTDLGEWEKRLQQLRRKHDLGAGHKRPFGMPPLFFSNEQFLECQKAFSCSNPYLYDLKLPFLRQLVEKLTEERVGGVKLGQVDRNWLQGSAIGDTEGLFGGFTNVELQIPSYKPTRSKCQGVPPTGRNMSHGAGESARPNRTIGESLKDIIAKSIAQKVRTRALLNNTSDTISAMKFGLSPECSRQESAPKTNGFMRESESVPEVKRPKLAVKVSRASVTREEEEEEDGERGRRHKQTRPKRGQYRKYNSQLLMEAVQSVQRGEMSVHRAGSFYGVPHSTLEYKVKERHLLRQKKAQMKTNDEVMSDDNAPEETSSSTDDPVPMSRPLTLGWPMFAKGGAAVPSAGFLPYESEFGLNTSASELLKKLQQKVVASSSLKTSVDDDVETNIATSAGVVSDAQVTVK